MEKKLITQVIITSAALALIGLVAVSCTTSTPAPTSAPTSPPATAAPELKGDVVRGGLLYDTWWMATAGTTRARTAPTARARTRPASPASLARGANRPARFWRP